MNAQDNMITTEQAKSLAIRYASFMTAHAENDKESMQVWALMLLEAQQDTGIELQDPAVLRRRINR